ncbi:MAG: helix-turn-helix transcriptional regulator [Pseudomonadota bacterium]
MAHTFGELLGAEIRERREAAGMTQRELAELSFPELEGDDGDDGRIEGKERRIRELEAGEVTRPQAKNYMPICETLSITRADIRALKAQAADAKAQQDAEFTEAFPGDDSVDEAINNPGALDRDELELLAGRFEIPDPHQASDADLRKLLTLKAEEYRALRAEVDGISDGLKRLSNLKAAAQDAIARVDLEEVEELLSRVQEVEKEEAARTAELRADNALLRGKVEQAAALLADAADSFRIIDPLEPARRRTHEYSEKLIRHGLRYGGDGLICGVELAKQPLNDWLRNTAPLIWAAGHNHIAIALQNQGTRTAGPEGAKLLAQAVTAYRAALEVRTRADHPVDWAMTQNNLANALQHQGTRTAGPEGADLVAQAVTAYRAALEVYTRADHPMPWATTQNNLGNAFANQGNRTAGPEGADLLAQAVKAYRAALDVTTRAGFPVEWADTQNNLGAALKSQGTRIAAHEGADLLSQAVTAYRAALEVRTRADHPVDWAMTQGNIAIALQAIAKHGTTDDPRPPLTEALTAVDLALEVFNPEHMSYDHENATKLRDYIRAALDALD